MANKKNTTKIRKGITRTIQPKQFESLQISVAYEDTISWDTKAERDKALANATELALADFEDTFDTVCEELGVKDKSAKVTHKTEDGEVKHAAVEAKTDKDKKPAPMTEEELDDIFDGVPS